MKYKNLTDKQILISIDRLTRFKPTKEKYLRVFYDIILSNLTEPHLRKNELERCDVSIIKDYAVEILNSSIKTLSTKNNNTENYNINEILKKYENSIYVNDEETQILLDNNINYSAMLHLINETSVINLKWLKSLNSVEDLINSRRTNFLKFPIEKIILVEGLTEEILLPAFSKKLGYDFYKNGVQVIPAGGKNQVVKMYYKLAEELKIPIFLLLDKDAEENIKQIQPKLRESDKIHLVSCGEFEDLLPKSLIIKTVNNELSNFAAISENDLSDELPEAKNLENIFKKVGLHEFKKADFAKLVKENINQDSDISFEIKNIIDEIAKS